MNFDYNSLLGRAYENMPEQTRNTARFELPDVDVLMEGNKTILKNFLLLTKAFRREPAHLQKFLTKDLGSYSLLSGERLVFNKKVYGKKIGEAVKKYAAEYVLCSECGKPDTRFTTLEGVRIIKCEACGAWRPVKNI
jgi:translation initiation factor 2 subunit 2